MRIFGTRQPGQLLVTKVDATPRLAFEAFGVPISVGIASAELLPRVQAVLPPGWQPCESVPEGHEFTLATRDDISYTVVNSRESLSASSDLDVALEILDSQLRAFIAVRAPEHIFVHAGVVAHEGRAIVMPGPTFGGKTTLVSELVREGAVYYSDEFAAVDSDGLVHPYPKPLSVRNGGFSQTNRDVTMFGGIAGTEPIPVGLILMTRYVPGARWEPEQLSAGEAVLAMLANTVPAQDRPEQSLAAISKAVDGAICLEGERGEAAELVGRLLELAVTGDVSPESHRAS
jgi:hypothetical protein